MRIPARALKPLVAMTIAAASFGCIAPAAYAENAAAAVISDDGDHVVVDVDLPSLLNGLISNPDIDADSAENSVE